VISKKSGRVEFETGRIEFDESDMNEL